MHALLGRRRGNGKRRSKSCTPRLESMESRVQLSTVALTGAGGNGVSAAFPDVGPVQPPQILSVASTTFTAGTAGTYTLTSVGLPVPSWSEEGSLPSGVTFVDNGDGSATLAGLPAADTGGLYSFKVTASNGQDPAAMQNFMLTVQQAPAITSAAGTALTVGKASSFEVTTTGYPTSTLSVIGALPTGVTFVDNGDGTASLAGTPAPGTSGTYHVKIDGANGVGSPATQNFTLTVSPLPQSPVITSASSMTFAAGAAATFMVTTTGVPAPTLTESGALPPGVQFVDLGNGSAELMGTAPATAAGAYHLTITASNGVAIAASQDFTLEVAITTAPRVVRLQRFGIGRQPMRIVLEFDQPMNGAAAQWAGNYVINPVVRGRVLTARRRRINVTSAAYDPATQTVTLLTRRRLSLHQKLQITVNSQLPGGLTNVSGVPLAGRNGMNFAMSFVGRASLRGIPCAGGRLSRDLPVLHSLAYCVPIR